MRKLIIAINLIVLLVDSNIQASMNKMNFSQNIAKLTQRFSCSNTQKQPLNNLLQHAYDLKTSNQNHSLAVYCFRRGYAYDKYAHHDDFSQLAKAVIARNELDEDKWLKKIQKEVEVIKKP